MTAYNQLPVTVDRIYVTDCEYMYYQYLPIKLPGMATGTYEARLSQFDRIIETAFNDYKRHRGTEEFIDSYVYLTAKRMIQFPGSYINRPGWHSDGFGTTDVNYIWSDCVPTVFNYTSFHLSDDDEKSLTEMKEQALECNNVTYLDSTLLRLNQYCIHRASDYEFPIVRSFVKISVSKDKYDLEGNSKNYDLSYDWDMKPRNIHIRNIPQTINKVGTK